MGFLGSEKASRIQKIGFIVVFCLAYLKWPAYFPFCHRIWENKVFLARGARALHRQRVRAGPTSSVACQACFACSCSSGPEADSRSDAKAHPAFVSRETGAFSNRAGVEIENFWQTNCCWKKYKTENWFSHARNWKASRSFVERKRVFGEWRLWRKN